MPFLHLNQDPIEKAARKLAWEDLSEKIKSGKCDDDFVAENLFYVRRGEDEEYFQKGDLVFMGKDGFISHARDWEGPEPISYWGIVNFMDSDNGYNQVSIITLNYGRDMHKYDKIRTHIDRSIYWLDLENLKEDLGKKEFKKFLINSEKKGIIIKDLKDNPLGKNMMSYATYNKDKVDNE